MTQLLVFINNLLSLWTLFCVESSVVRNSRPLRNCITRDMLISIEQLFSNSFLKSVSLTVSVVTFSAQIETKNIHYCLRHIDCLMLIHTNTYNVCKFIFIFLIWCVFFWLLYLFQICYVMVGCWTIWYNGSGVCICVIVIHCVVI